MPSNTNNQCLECGARAMEAFSGEQGDVTHLGYTTVLANLSGKRCSVCGEVVLSDESTALYAKAGDELVLRAREQSAVMLKRVRKKLGLTQLQASDLTGGGHNAFSRYESCAVAPMPAIVNLFTLLDHHPELLREIT